MPHTSLTTNGKPRSKVVCPLCSHVSSATSAEAAITGYAEHCEAIHGETVITGRH